jgi:DNA-binding transcriptional MerR regulator
MSSYMTNQKWITTGPAARRLKLSSERVRQLESEGVLASTRTENGIRLFLASDVEKLAMARAANQRGKRV